MVDFGEKQSDGVDFKFPVVHVDEEVSPEQEKIANAAVKFADFLVSKWPQKDDGREINIPIDRLGNTLTLPPIDWSVPNKPKLNYYIVGSLATMLLAKADTVSSLTGDDLPEINEEGEVKNIPETTKKILAKFSRQIGDLDYVPSEFYSKNNPNRLRKGGGGPSFDEVPDEASLVLKKESKTQVKVMCDPVPSKNYEKNVVKVTVDGKDFYIASPDSMLGYKILHLLESYSSKPDKFNNDFAILFNALVEMYGYERLLEVTRRIVLSAEENSRQLYYSFHKDDQDSAPYVEKYPGMIKQVLDHAQISPEIKLMLEDISAK